MVERRNHSTKITMVNGEPNERIKSRNWDTMRELKHGRRGPWACIRDFNDIQEQHEKTGGLPNDQRKTDRFNGLINDLSLINLGSKGPKFMWCNNRQGQARIRE